MTILLYAAKQVTPKKIQIYLRRTRAMTQFNSIQIFAVKRERWLYAYTIISLST